MWTAARLQRWIGASEFGGPIVVLANREPVRHDRAADGAIVAKRSGGGLVTALEPLVEACSGVWVAHGAGTADRAVVDRRDGVALPPANPAYRLRRVWLDDDEQRGYYLGFSNEALWPLCHRTHVRPVFRSDDFHTYRTVNARFAAAVCDEVESEAPLVLVQDYHFALAPRMIRRRLPFSTVMSFWHIPWPHPRDYEVCPWARELLTGLLGSDILGFQTPTDCRHFVDAAKFLSGARVDAAGTAITYAGRRTVVRAYPISIEWPSRWACRSPAVRTCRETICRQLRLDAGTRLAVGVDRLDYTKGIGEKCLAVEKLLELHPELVGRFVFVQIAEPSRNTLPAYRALGARLGEIAARINGRFGSGHYQPVVLLETHHEPADVYRYLRAADVCYVGSLHDGMNLVAKEFVAARDDERGVLVLSRFAGAARELTGALIVNPYAIEQSARVLAQALGMTDDEQAMRMRAMRSIVAECNAYKWVGEMLTDAARVRARPRRRVNARRRRYVEPRRDRGFGAPSGFGEADRTRDAIA